jgi:hypothetical protein
MNTPKPIFLRSAALILLGLLTLIPVRAGADDTVTTSTDLMYQLSSRPELKMGLTQSFTFPFLRGGGPLTRDNNIRLALTAELSPVSINGLGDVLWTPIAFLQVAAGGRIGSGWNIKLFGSEIYGIGINRRGDLMADGIHHKEEISGEAFDSIMWRAYGGVALQFDLAALIPGDWSHIVFRGYNEGRYSAYNRASFSDSWVFEDDEGQNRNGWTWYSSFLIGYQMPLSPVLDTIAFMAEGEKNLYTVPGGDVWGDNLTHWIFSLLFNFTITPRFSIASALQMRTLNNYGTSDLENQDGIYYQDLVLQKNYGTQRLSFFRAAMIMTYKLK